MALVEHGHQEATHKQLENCIKWCRNKFDLRDWEITLDTNKVPPKDVDSTTWRDCGRCWSRSHYLKALIWVSPDRCKILQMNPYRAIIHEMLHILVGCRGNADVDDQELVCYTLEGLVYQVFCKEKKIRPAKIITEIVPKWYED